EPFGPLRIVDAGYLHQLLIFEPVAQGAADVGDRFAPDGEGDFADLVLGFDEGVAERSLDLVNQAFARSDQGCGAGHRSTLDRADAADLPLQLHDAVEERFGRRRTAGHIDVDRHDAVAAAHHRIAVMIIAAAIGAA